MTPIPMTSADESLVGYILMENDTTFKDVDNLKVFNENHLFYVRFDATLQSLDEFNRNNRYYDGDAIVASLSTPEIAELIANNKFKGEAGHPIDQPINRIATVDPKYTCHRIIKWWREKNLIRGTVETLDDGMWGTKLTKSILQNENPSFSYRGLAMVQKKGNKSYVYRPPRAVAYDEVNLPSHKQAYGDPEKTKIVQGYNGQITTMESTQAESRYPLGDMSRMVMEQEIVDLVNRKSDNLQIVCESFDLDPSTVTVKNGKMVLRQGDETYAIAMESAVCNDISYYWGSL